MTAISTTTPMRTAPTVPQHRLVDVELLALDLSTCTRCTGSLANIEQAISAVRRVAEPMGTTLRLRTTLVETEEQARAARFVSSPTIRVDGRDITFETRESLCDSCTDLCGCDEGTSCRVWSYQGEAYTEAPVGLVVEALLGAIAPGAATNLPVTSPAVTDDFFVPANLRTFFAGRTVRSGNAEAGTESPGACCPPSELETCCAPSEKASCCTPVAASCGCA